MPRPEPIRIVLAGGFLADYLEGGGHWTCFLQHLLGLRALGHDVFWLELLRSCGDRGRDLERVGGFFARMAEYGLAGRSIVLLRAARGQGADPLEGDLHGATPERFRELAATADVLWNFASTVRQPLLSLFRRRAFVDVDPGHLQVSAASWDMGLDGHDVFFTVGLHMNAPDCEVPRVDRIWHPFPPVVFLPMWQPRAAPAASAPFTSITQWTWESFIPFGGRTLSASKRDAYLRYLDLPRRCRRPFELAVNLAVEDATGDRERLVANGWRLVHPHDMASTPLAYQEYIARSRAEILCPKPIFRELRTGWFSDRSACFLACGRPVLAEETGFGRHLPTGAGLLAFTTADDAVAGVAAIDADYARHAREARELARAYLDSAKILTRMIDLCAA